MNLSLCKHSEIAVSIFCLIENQFDMLLYILLSNSLNMNSFSCITYLPIKTNNLISYNNSKSVYIFLGHPVYTTHDIKLTTATATNT